VQHLSGIDAESLLCSFLWTDAAWVYSAMIGGLILPATSVERVCATICVHDYETRQKLWLSTLLSTIISITAVATAFYHKFGMFATLLVWSLWVLHQLSSVAYISILNTALALALINLVGLGIFLYCDMRNMSFYLKSISYIPATRQSHAGLRDYSLSERFQTIQNVRFAQVGFLFLSIPH